MDEDYLDRWMRERPRPRPRFDDSAPPPGHWGTGTLDPDWDWDGETASQHALATGPMTGPSPKWLRTVELFGQHRE